MIQFKGITPVFDYMKSEKGTQDIHDQIPCLVKKGFMNEAYLTLTQLLSNLPSHTRGYKYEKGIFYGFSLAQIEVIQDFS